MLACCGDAGLSIVVLSSDAAERLHGDTKRSRSFLLLLLPGLKREVGVLTHLEGEHRDVLLDRSDWRLAHCLAILPSHDTVLVVIFALLFYAHIGIVHDKPGRPIIIRIVELL